MVSWQEEKEKYLSMSADNKRNVYKGREYVKLDAIPTWKQYATEHHTPAGQTDHASTPLRHPIDATKNEKLAEKVSVFIGDITSLELDAIVNAANTSLMGGGGVDGAIHSAAGSSLKDECSSLKGCKVGQAKLTGGYKLPAKYVIHTVGPRGEKPDLLSACYRNSLETMRSKRLRTIAFPCVSTGIYGYPNEEAAHVALSQTRQHLEAHGDEVDRVIFCLFTDDDKYLYPLLMQSYFPLSN